MKKKTTKKTTKKIKHQKHQTCVMCHKKLINTTIDSISMQLFAFVCVKPDCPNYGLLQIGEENLNSYLKGFK